MSLPKWCVDCWIGFHVWFPSPKNVASSKQILSTGKASFIRDIENDSMGIKSKAQNTDYVVC